MIFEGQFVMEGILEFMGRRIGATRGWLFLLVDRRPVRRSKQVEA